MNKMIIRKNFTNMMDNQFVMEFHKRTPQNTRIYIKKIVYNALYLLLLFYLIYIVQWYKRITNQQQYELMMYISRIINSTMSTISKVPLLRKHFTNFTEQQNINKSIIIEKYALYGTNILYHFIQVLKKVRQRKRMEFDSDLGKGLWDVVSLIWSIQASPHSELGKIMNRVTRRTNFVMNIFGFNTRNNRMRKRIREVHAAHVGFIMMCLQKLVLEGFVTLTSQITRKNEKIYINLKNYNTKPSSLRMTNDLRR